jgi:cyanuric acid amidohydrolase
MTELHWFDMADPSDYSGLEALLQAGGAVRRLAVLVKTEGHTAANDFARQLSRAALDPMLGPLAREGRAVAILANGCEGVATPGGYALLQREAVADGGLRFGIASSAPLSPETIGTAAAIDAFAACVAAACVDAGLTAGEAALAIVKCPTRLASTCLGEPFRSDQHRGRAIAALGVAVAFGEIERSAIGPASIASDPDLRSARAMTFAGPEQDRVEAIVLGNGAGTGLQVGVCHPRDMLDAGAIRRLLLSLGLGFDAAGELTEPERIGAIFSKAGPAADGRVRGARTGIFTSAYSADSNMRAAQSGLLGGLFGTTRFFVSGDPVQQAPAGGGVVAVIVKPRKTP